MSHTEKVIVLVDMDCFYCQVEEKLDSNLEGKPIAVVQYNAWRGGGIIAVNYPAREKGVTRHMRGDEAREKCPEIILAKVPEVRGKADLTKYREAGKKVADVLKTFTPLLERASVDEAYLDITEVVNKRINTDFEKVNVENLKNTFVVGWEIKDFLYNIHKHKEYTESNCKLAMGALIVEEIRAEVYKRAGYKCSAGIAHNKILAKLVCGLHKPNKQTILPQESICELYKNMPIRKVKNLGGKFGNTLSEEFNITKMGELCQFSKKELADRFDEKTANWLYDIARGIDLEPVTTRLLSKSIGCCKNFSGTTALVTPESVAHWINELASEITERLEKDLEENNRKAKQMVVSFTQEINRKNVSSSRTVPLYSYDQTKIAQIGSDMLKKFCLKSGGTYNIKYLGISAGNFEEIKKSVNIATFFKNIKDSKNLKKSSFQKECDITTSEVYRKPANTEDRNNTLSDNKNKLEEETSSAENTCDDGNTSVYSASTEELNEDAKSFIYYEDIYPESVASQPILERCSNKFIGRQDILKCQGGNVNEFSSDNSNSSNEISNDRLSSSSFFTKYFKSSSVDCNTPVNRNFDTSKILKEIDLEYSEEKASDEYIENGILNDNSLKMAEIDKKVLDIASDLKESCPECNKNILPWELVAHMDYHFALKIVRNEAHLYKPSSSTVPEVKVDRKAISQSVKRKVTNELKPILTFFQKEELNDENSVLCSECSKRIKVEEIANHTDYHTAKKLHLEINSQTYLTLDKNTTAKIGNKSKDKKKKNVKPSKNIDMFFK